MLAVLREGVAELFSWAAASEKDVYANLLGEWGVYGPKPWSLGFIIYWGVTFLPQLWMLPMLILEWRSSFKLFGVDSLRLRRRLIAIKAHNPIRDKLRSHFAVPLAFAVIASRIWFVTGADYLCSVITLSVIVCLWNSYLLPIPPAVLFLSSSGPYQNKTRLLLTGGLWPVRVSTLMNTQSTPMIRLLFANDDFRTPDALWRETVRELCSIAKIVIVDIRVPTNALKWEVAELKSGNHLAKTLVLTSNKNEDALSDLFPPGAVRMLPERTLIETVRRLTRSKDSLPSKGPVTYESSPRDWALIGHERWDYGGLLCFTANYLKWESKGKGGFLAHFTRRARLVTIENQIEKLVRAKLGAGVPHRNRALQDIVEDLEHITTCNPNNPDDTLEDPRAKEAAKFLVAFVNRLPLPFGRGRYLSIMRRPGSHSTDRPGSA